MSKTYRLKAWDEVKNHSFIPKETWDTLASCDALEVTFYKGFFADVALIFPKGETSIFLNSYLVKKEDLLEVEDNAHPNNPEKNEAKKSDDTCIEPEEKTYTKDEIREAGARLMREDFFSDANSAVIGALTIAKLVNKLN